MYVRRLYMRAKSNGVFGDGSTRVVCAFWPAWTCKLPLCRRIEWNCERERKREREVKEEKKNCSTQHHCGRNCCWRCVYFRAVNFVHCLCMGRTPKHARTRTVAAHVFVRRVHSVGTCSITQPCVPAHVTPKSLGPHGRMENSVRCDRKGEQCALATAATVWVLLCSASIVLKKTLRLENALLHPKCPKFELIFFLIRQKFRNCQLKIPNYLIWFESMSHGSESTEFHFPAKHEFLCNS